jgi:hypothetical protein
MMSDKKFAELELRAMICPRQCFWPRSEEGHWKMLHEAANEARARLRNVNMQMDEIDANVELTRDAKYQERSKLATHATAEFEGSKTLICARRAVELMAAEEDAAWKALKETEAGWQTAINKICERAALTRGADMRRGATAVT